MSTYEVRRIGQATIAVPANTLQTHTQTYRYTHRHTHKRTYRQAGTQTHRATRHKIDMLGAMFAFMCMPV